MLEHGSRYQEMKMDKRDKKRRQDSGRQDSWKKKMFN